MRERDLPRENSWLGPQGLGRCREERGAGLQLLCVKEASETQNNGNKFKYCAFPLLPVETQRNFHVVFTGVEGNPG